MIKVMHIITSLNVGGAEMMLYKLIAGMDRTQISCEVICLSKKGAVANKIEQLGIKVNTLNIKDGYTGLKGFKNTVALLKQFKPDIVQTWLYHADLLGGLASIFGGDIPVIWGIRNSALDIRAHKRKTIWIARICALLSGIIPSKILCCSYASKSSHVNMGYNQKKMIVIPNGFDLEEFKPDLRRKLEVRKKLNILNADIVIGLVGRFDPQKDHHTFIKAASIISNKTNNIKFILCGEGITLENPILRQWVHHEGNLDNKVYLLGIRNDIVDITRTFDIASSSSSCGEGFPNVIGEAMALCIPCVATDVGDSAIIIGNTGKIVEALSPESLANAWMELISLDAEKRCELGNKARLRIAENYNLCVIIEQYLNLYKNVLMI